MRGGWNGLMLLGQSVADDAGVGLNWLSLGWSTAAASSLAVFNLALRLAVAFGLGALVAWIYRQARRDQWASPTFPATLVLLAILIAMVTHVIGDNIARAFSLVGALSIVRFRTVVEDTFDIAFVIFAVVVGMAAGATSLWAAIFGTVLVGAAAWLVRPKPTAVPNDPGTPSKLVVRIGLGRSPDQLLGPVLDRCASERRIASVATGRGGTILEIEYAIRLRSGVSPIALVDELNRQDGIQQVELTPREI